MLMCIWIAQARTKCGSRLGDPAGPRHFPCKFPHEVALVKSWHAFRLRRLAQSVCLRSGLNLGRSIFPAHFRIKWLLRNLHRHFHSAGSRKVWVPALGSVFLLNIILHNIILLLLTISSYITIIHLFTLHFIFCIITLFITILTITIIIIVVVIIIITIISIIIIIINIISSSSPSSSSWSSSASSPSS